MASEIVLWDPLNLADADYRIDFRFENTVNAPLPAGEVELLNSGQEIADVYTLVFTVVGPAVSVAVTCGAGSKNPYTQTGTSVTADGTTRNEDVIGGVSFAVAAGVATGWTGKISIGAIMTAAGATTDITNHGIVEAGASSTQTQIAAKNVGADDSVTTTIGAVPGFYWTPLDAYAFVKCINNHSDDTREHQAAKGDYTITFANWGDDAPSGKKKCDILVGGNTAVTTALFDGATAYEYGVTGYDDGNDYLQGLQITLQDTVADPTAVTVTLHVMDGDDWEELAADVAGAPGAWTTGDLTLTESGELAGTITAGNSALFWNRWNIPDGTSPDTLRMQRFSVRGLTV